MIAKTRVNLGKIGKAARWMDMKDERGAVALLQEVIDSALTTDDDPISFCEAHLFLADICVGNGDPSAARRHLQEALTIRDDRAEEAQRRARQALSRLAE